MPLTMAPAVLPAVSRVPPVTCPPAVPGGAPSALPDKAVAGAISFWKAAAVEGARYWSRLPARGFPP